MTISGVRTDPTTIDRDLEFLRFFPTLRRFGRRDAVGGTFLAVSARAGDTLPGQIWSSWGSGRPGRKLTSRARRFRELTGSFSKARRMHLEGHSRISRRLDDLGPCARSATSGLSLSWPMKRIPDPGQSSAARAIFAYCRGSGAPLSRALDDPRVTDLSAPGRSPIVRVLFPAGPP